MKTTLEIPDPLLRQAKALAARKGVSLSCLVAQAIEAKLRVESAVEKPWMRHFGALRDLHEETQRIDRIIEEEFGQIEPEDRL